MSWKQFVSSTLALLISSSIAHAEAPGIYAITGGTIHPVKGPEIKNGVLIIREGLIESVGPSSATPADATVIDASGLHVYPGLIDAQTTLGLPAPPAKSATEPPRDEATATDATPSLRADRIFRPADDTLDAKRATGVTTVLIAPVAGIFNGQSAIVNLQGGARESMIVRSPATIQISFNPRSSGKYPDSLMGVVAYIRQMFLDAQQHVTATGIYRQDPAGRQRPVPSGDLDVLAEALRRELPVVFIADSEGAMRRAHAIAKEFGLRYIISGARHAYKTAAELERLKVPVLLSVQATTAPADKAEREEQPLRLIAERVLGPTSGAELKLRKVEFALVSGAAKSPGNFIAGIRRTIESGLSKDAALEAVTLAPARILGIDRQLGTLEKGKIANVVLTDKEIFAREAKVKQLFIDGRPIQLPKDEPKPSEDAASPVSGSWTLLVSAPDGEITITASIKVDGATASGSFSGDRGSGDIRNGTFEAGQLAFTITLSSKGETSDWAFRGQVEGDKIEGTVSTTAGTYQFTGSKPK